MDTLSLMIAVFVFINLVAFFMMLADKARSRKAGAERLSEGILFFMATMFGSIGVYVGMFAFRHKTRKWYFIIGIPTLMVENMAFLYCLSRYL